MPASLRIAGLVAVLAAFFHPAAHAVQDCELNGQSVNPANGNTTAGKTGLMRCKDRDSGELMREQQLQNGVFMGLVRFYDKGKLAEGAQRQRQRQHAWPGARVLAHRPRAARSDLRERPRDGPRAQLPSRRPGAPHRLLCRAGGERASAEFTERGQLSALRCGDKPMLAPAVDDARLCGFVNGPSQVELFDGKGTLRSRLAYAAGKRVRSEELYDNGKPSLQDEIIGNQRIERRLSSEGVKRREVVCLLVERGAITAARAGVLRERHAGARPALERKPASRYSDESYYLNGQPRSKARYGVGRRRARSSR